MIKFITCVYNKLHNTTYGGALNRENHYLFSLRSIANINSPLTCYISDMDYKRFSEYLTSKNIKNVSFVEYDLSNFLYHNEIKKIRTTHPEYNEIGWNNRCVEIMWGKIYWMESTFKDLNDDDKIFWIDAGLSHGGLFPKKFNTWMVHHPTKENLEMAFQYDKVFNEKLVEFLDKNTSTNNLFFETTQPQYEYPEKYKNFYNHKTSIIAGLFGGKKSTMMPLISEFKKIAEDTIKNNYLLREEQILTVLHDMHPEFFNNIIFDTWYHEDWDVYQKELRSFSDFTGKYNV